MNLKLTVYKNDDLTEVKRVAEADRLKIPYRVSIFILQTLENDDIKNDVELAKYVAKNIDKMDKILKATFRVTDEELDCLDSSEMIRMVVEIYKWGMEKVKGISSGDEKN